VPHEVTGAANRGRARLPGVALLWALGGCALVRPAPPTASPPALPPPTAEAAPDLRDGPGEPWEALAFAAAEEHHRRGEAEQALAVLDGLAARADLSPAGRVRALTERGVVALEQGDASGAERSLLAALALADGSPRPVGLPAHARPKTCYWLGEVERSRFLAAALDVSAGAEALAAALEDQAALLLRAQERYLSAAAPGAGSFGVAGVARVGDLYQAFHDRLASAAPPPDLGATAAAAWRAELRSHLAVLVRKAAEAYQAALLVARRAGVEGNVVEGAERSLARLRELLPEP
jgi:hypothetical protein